MSQSDRLPEQTIDYELVFNLIDVVFSLESCLHHQVLPLKLSENHLILGMVCPTDKKTIQLIKPMINSLGHTFSVRGIDSQTHQMVLASYLKRDPKDFIFNNSDKSVSYTHLTLPTIYSV